VQTNDTLTTAKRRGRPWVADAVRHWQSITLHLPGWLLGEFTRLAKELNVSRSRLVRESLEFGGLGYAQAQARRKREEAAQRTAAVEVPA
jgi:metal-responsive CopG/Arc/MetJ family transcriptional regulator